MFHAGCVTEHNSEVVVQLMAISAVRGVKFSVAPNAVHGCVACPLLVYQLQGLSHWIVTAPFCSTSVLVLDNEIA